MRDQPAAPEPRLMIAIAASTQGDHAGLRESLASAGLLNQPDIRVCVAQVDEPAMDSPDDNLSLFRFSSHTPFFEQYATIIRQTRSRYIALLDASCPPTEGWLRAVRQRMRDETPVFYGPVNSGWPGKDFRNIGYLIEYAQFREPLDPTLPEYPGNNIAFQRKLLQDVPLVGSGFQKTFFVRQVRDKLGITPFACNDMSVTYRKQFSWGYYLRRRYCHGRLYGASHAEILGYRRLLYAVGILILPLLRYSRILRASRRAPVLTGNVLRFSVPILVSECAWSVGECAGYMAGAPDDGVFLD
ncbi:MULTISPECIES: hypothetical protein [Marinobacter]|uniref:Glycosyltransferase n=1 Tax=Marinobacter metalliresistant TaxID=2961995 RepID=A0ABZ2W3H5_9GAMM|nr:hypothetical protein [Marinobacter sp. SS8-8]